MRGHGATRTPVGTPSSVPGLPLDGRSNNTSCSGCPQLSGDQIRASVTAIVDATSAANEVFASVQPDPRGPMAFMRCVDAPPFSFGDWVKVFSRAGRDDIWLAALILADRCCQRTGVACTGANKHRLMMVAYLVAIKCHIDCRRFSRRCAVMGGIGLYDLNIMEQKFLEAIDWEAYISAQTYEAYAANLGSIEADAKRAAAAAGGEDAGAARSEHYNLLPLPADFEEFCAPSPQLTSAHFTQPVCPDEERAAAPGPKGSPRAGLRRLMQRSPVARVPTPPCAPSPAHRGAIRPGSRHGRTSCPPPAQVTPTGSPRSTGGVSRARQRIADAQQYSTATASPRSVRGGRGAVPKAWA